MRRRLMRLKRLRHDPFYPMVLVGAIALAGYVVFIIRLIWG